MNTLKLMTGIAVIGMIVSCKSSIQPVTTLGGENPEVAQTMDEPAAEAEESTMNSDNAVTMESPENTSMEAEPATMDTPDAANMEETNMETPSTMNSGETDDMETPVVEDYNGTTGANSNIQEDAMVEGEGVQDFDAMYTHLEMTDEQIDQFTSAMQQYSNEMNSNSAGGEEGGIMEEQDRILEDILSEEQLAKYEDWKQNN